MKTILHTIAFEPVRWTLQRASRSLAEWLPRLAERGVRRLEIYEPHLALAPDEAALPAQLQSLGLEPVVLSSYLNPDPAKTDDAVFADAVTMLVNRVARFGFERVRLFPGPKVDPADDAQVAIVQERIAQIARRLPGTELLLETHEKSIADDPARLVRLVEELGLPNVALLYQPVLNDVAVAREQWALQKPLIRHLHFQNRNAEGHFARMAEGIIPWRELVATLPQRLEATLEFVPSGVHGTFDFETTLDEALSELKEIESYWI